MVRSALVVSVASRAGACAGRFVGALPAASAATANGGRAGEQSDECADGPAAGTAAVVCDALVVSARWHRDDAAIDDTRRSAGGNGYDASSTGDAARHDAAAASGGHVFCLTAPVTEYASG